MREIPAAPSKLAAGVLRLSSPPAAPAESTDLPPPVSASCGTRGKSTRRWDWRSHPCISYLHPLRLYGGEQAPGDEQTTTTIPQHRENTLKIIYNYTSGKITIV